MVRSSESKLPYINSFVAVAVTGIIAVVSVLAHNRGNVSLSAALTDSIYFGILTFVIDTAIVYPQVRKRYREGTLPENPPVSKILRHTPRNPAVFAILGAAVFAGVTVLFTWVFFRFYQLEEMALGSFLFYRVLFAVFFSAWMTKVVILRYVQKGAFKEDIPQHGSQEVKAAIPSLSTLKEEFNSARMDFGLNMILGVILGGTQVGMDLGLNAGETKWLFIFPTTRSGLPLSVFIYSLIVFVLMVVPVVKSIRASRLQGQLPVTDKPIAFFERLPRKPWAFAAVWLLPLFGFSYLIIWGIMTVMKFEVLNFFQYYFIRLACTKILTVGIVNLSVIRYMQPDIQIEEVRE